MNKIVCSVLGVLIFCSFFIGCGKPTTDDFVDPVKQTNQELLIYTGQDMKFFENGALAAYQAEHPGVKVTIVDEEYYGLAKGQYEELSQKVSVEILAGEGPDLFYLQGTRENVFHDVQKVIRSGVFYDMNHSIKADKSFQRSDYYEPVLDVGIVDGKQYIFPISFYFPILLTTQEVLNETNLKLKNCTTYNDLFDTLYRYRQENPDEKRMSLDPMIFYFGFLPQLQAMNYEAQEVNFNTPKIKKVLEQAKEIVDRDNKLSGGSRGWGTENVAQAFKNDTQLFSIERYGEILFQTAAAVSETKTLVFQPLKNSEGELEAVMDGGLAINVKSHNKQNAYDFIKVVIDPNRQTIYESEYLEFLEKKGKKPNYSFTSGKQSVVKEKALNDMEEFKRVFDQGWYLNPDTVLENSDGTTTFPNSVVKPLPFGFYKDYAAMLNEIAACEMNTGLYEKAMEYIKPYFEGEKSIDDCLKQAQDQLELYMSE